MGLPVQLEEIEDAKLREELLRRSKLRWTGRCAYCTRLRNTNPCKMAKEHDGSNVQGEPDWSDTEKAKRDEAIARVEAALRGHYGIDHDEKYEVRNLIYTIVSCAAVYWRGRYDDFLVQSFSYDAIVFGGHNRVTWNAAFGFQIHPSSCTEAFMRRYLMVGPNPSEWV